jgi:hypothetical protein
MTYKAKDSLDKALPDQSLTPRLHMLAAACNFSFFPGVLGDFHSHGGIPEWMVLDGFHGKSIYKWMRTGGTLMNWKPPLLILQGMEVHP